MNDEMTDSLLDKMLRARRVVAAGLGRSHRPRLDGVGACNGLDNVLASLPAIVFALLASLVLPPVMCIASVGGRRGLDTPWDTYCFVSCSMPRAESACPVSRLSGY